MDNDDKLMNLLKELSDPISTVDGGCSVCVRGLVKRVNNILFNLGIYYHYEVTEDHGDVILVSGMRYEKDLGDD